MRAVFLKHTFNMISTFPTPNKTGVGTVLAKHVELVNSNLEKC